MLSLNNLPDNEINKMTYENATRWYSFAPFTHITRERATVGALRKATEATTSASRPLATTKRANGTIRRLCKCQMWATSQASVVLRRMVARSTREARPRVEGKTEIRVCNGFWWGEERLRWILAGSNRPSCAHAVSGFASQQVACSM